MSAIKLKNVSAAEFKTVVDIDSYYEGRKAFPRGTKSVLQAIKIYLTRQRQGTVKTKTKANVRGGGKKPFKQKGTGSARQGSIRSPLMPGGGIAHGPQPRPWNPKINQKEAALAFSAAFVDHLKANSVFMVDGFDLKASSKSSNWRVCLKNAEKSILLSSDETEVIGARNFKNMKIVNVKTVNIYDLVWADRLIVKDKAELNEIKTRFKNLDK